MRKIIKTTETKAWEKRTVVKLVRMVHSSPHNLQNIFGKLRSQKRMSRTRASAPVVSAWGRVGLLQVVAVGGGGTVPPQRRIFDCQFRLNHSQQGSD